MRTRIKHTDILTYIVHMRILMIYCKRLLYPPKAYSIS